MSIEVLKFEIESRDRQAVEKTIARYAKRNNWASDINDCEKEMYHSIMDWDKKPLPSVHLAKRFEKGRKEESEAIQRLMALGFDVVEGQCSFQLTGRSGELICSGKIDGKIQWDGKKYPFEVKSMHPNKFDRVETIKDLLDVDWTAKYVRQLQIYLYANNIEQGMFFITDCLGHFKLIIVHMDLEMMEGILQKCERVTDAVKTKTPPAFIKDASKCRKCWAYKTACFPPIEFGLGVTVLDDPELLENLKRRDEVAPMAKEYEALDKMVKEQLKGYENVIVGNYEAKTKTIVVKYKEKLAYESIQKRVSIDRIDEDITVQIDEKL